MITKYPQWKHQARGYNFVLNRPRGALLAIPMAGGKTKVAIDLIQNSDAKKILIVAPLAVIPAWKTEFEKHAVEFLRYPVYTLDEGSIKERTELAEQVRKANIGSKAAPVYIINYQAVWREPFRSWVLKQQWDLVNADECHRLKTAGGKTSMFFNTLKKRTGYRMGMSGFPMPHSPLDIYAQARFIDDRVFGTRKEAFINRYCFLGGFSGRQIIGWQNMDELNAKFHDLAFTVPDEELDLPEEVDVKRYTRLEPAAHKIYKELQKEFIVGVRNKTITAANALVKQLRLQQITGGWVKDTNGDYQHVSTAKLDLLEDLLLDSPPGEPMVIVCRFLPELAAVRDTLSRLGRSNGELSGRRSDLQEWQAGGLQDLVVQVQAGSEGIDLSRSRFMIFYSPGNRLGDYQQIRRRIARPTQKADHVRHIHLIVRGTEDERTYRAFANNMEIIDLVQREEA